MSSLSNQIQKHLKELLERSEKDHIEIQRSKLAEQFLCVPSQINYVLSTRFTVAQGYMVETRQGGGGYVRIIKLPPLKSQRDAMLKHIIGHRLSEKAGESILKRFQEESLLSLRELILLSAVLKNDVLAGTDGDTDELRAEAFKRIIMTLLRKEFQSE